MHALILLVALLFGAPFAIAEKEAPKVSALQTGLEAIRQKHAIPAIGAVVIEGGKIKELEVVGLRSAHYQTEVTKDDRWHLGSNTKSLTATLAARLIASGDHKLGWDTTLGSVFAEIPMHESYKNVTLQDLLAHRGGVTEDLTKLEDGKIWNKLWAPRVIPADGRYLVTRAVLTKEPGVPPKTKHVYSDIGYLIAAAMLEKQTQQTWEELMRKELFRPLRMYNCGFGSPAAEARTSPDEPWGHTLAEGVYTPVLPGRTSDHPPTMGPAGTVHCSLRDWANFAEAHLLALKGKKTTLMSANAYRDLHKDYKDQGYTPGAWRIRKGKGGSDKLTYWHTGTNTMNYAMIVLDTAKDRAMLVTTNIGDDKTAEKVFQEVRGLLEGPSPFLFRDAAN